MVMRRTKISTRGYFWIKKQIPRAKNITNMKNKVERIEIWIFGFEMIHDK